MSRSGQEGMLFGGCDLLWRDPVIAVEVAEQKRRFAFSIGSSF